MSKKESLSAELDRLHRKASYFLRRATKRLDEAVDALLCDDIRKMDAEIEERCRLLREAKK